MSYDFDVERNTIGIHQIIDHRINERIWQIEDFFKQKWNKLTSVMKNKDQTINKQKLVIKEQRLTIERLKHNMTKRELSEINIQYKKVMQENKKLELSVEELRKEGQNMKQTIEAFQYQVFSTLEDTLINKKYQIAVQQKSFSNAQNTFKRAFSQSLDTFFDKCKLQLPQALKEKDQDTKNGKILRNITSGLSNISKLVPIPYANLAMEVLTKFMEGWYDVSSKNNTVLEDQEANIKSLLFMNKDPNADDEEKHNLICQSLGVTLAITKQMFIYCPRALMKKNENNPFIIVLDKQVQITMGKLTCSRTTSEERDAIYVALMLVSILILYLQIHHEHIRVSGRSLEEQFSEAFKDDDFRN